MGANSIKTNLSKDDIISEIRLSLGADIEHEHTFMIVEGEDDVKFWKNIIDEKVTIFDSYSGKEGIRTIIQDHFDSNPRVIGIRDRDYEYESIHHHIFCYDYCCLELMLIKNDYALNSIYNEFYTGELSSNELREKILNELKYLSLVRKSNEVQKLGIKINGISIDNVYNRKTKTIDKTKIIIKLNDMNNEYFETNADKLEEINLENNKPLNSEELLNITQGHDFITLFNIFCKKNKGSNVNDKVIAASLRCAYRKIDFMSTSLCSQLIAYGYENNLKII